MELLFHGDAPLLDAVIAPATSLNNAGCPLVYSIEVSRSVGLSAARCFERTVSTDWETACTCVLVPSQEGLLVLPFSSEIMVRLHPRTTVLASQLVTQSASGNFSVLETAVPLRTRSGIPSGVDIAMRALPDVVDNRVTQRFTTGYTLFSQGAVYSSGARRLSLQGNENITATFSIQLENLGRVAEVDLKITGMQAVSSAFGLIVGSLGALRLLFRYTRKTQRSIKARRPIRTKHELAVVTNAVPSKMPGPPLCTGGQADGAVTSLQSWRSNPLVQQQPRKGNPVV